MAYLRSVTLGAAAALSIAVAAAALTLAVAGAGAAADAEAAAGGASSFGGALLHAASPNQTKDNAKVLTPAVYSRHLKASFL
jgi:hypothetical protein